MEPKTSGERQRSKLMIATLVLLALAVLAVAGAALGEWWLIHRAYPEAFPNDPDSDHGFRLLRLYWMSAGGILIFLALLFWGCGTFAHIALAVSRRALLTSGPGLVCGAFQLLLVGFTLWLRLRNPL